MEPLFMKIHFLIIALALSFVLHSSVRAQSEDCRQISGLPIQIGAQIICGQVKIRGLTPTDPRPTIQVTLLTGGVPVERMRAGDNGYYYFQRSAGNTSSLIFEVNEIEVGRVQLMAGMGNTTRRDVEVDLSSLSNFARGAPGVVSVQDNYPRTAEANKLFSQAMAYAKANQRENAIAAFSEIVAKDPKDFVAWSQLGTLNFEKNPKLAREAYQKALEAKPDFFFVLLNYGKLELAQKNYDTSVELLTKALSIDPSSADANHYLGEAYLGAKKGSKAVVYLNEAIRLSPIAKAEIHLRLASLYHAANLKDRAAAEYKLFLTKVPDHPEKKRFEQYIADHSPK